MGQFASILGHKLIQPTGLSQPATSFTLFPKLAIEVQLMIWRHSLPGPRWFEFVAMFEPGEVLTSYAHCKDKKIALLGVNRESRMVVREEYKQFRTNCTGCPPMYFCPTVDVFCFAHWLDMDEMENNLEYTTQHIPIKRIATTENLGKEWLKRLKLDELFLVDSRVELEYYGAGIIGFQDGWTARSFFSGHLEEIANLCEELEEEVDDWVAPVIRVGSWVLANPSEYAHNEN